MIIHIVTDAMILVCICYEKCCNKI